MAADIGLDMILPFGERRHQLIARRVVVAPRQREPDVEIGGGVGDGVEPAGGVRAKRNRAPE